MLSHVCKSDFSVSIDLMALFLPLECLRKVKHYCVTKFLGLRTRDTGELLIPYPPADKRNEKVSGISQRSSCVASWIKSGGFS